MAESIPAREAPLPTSSKEAIMSSGKLTELPTIHQKRALGDDPEPSTLRSDQIDFAASSINSARSPISPRSPLSAKSGQDEAADYLNGGLPHDDVSPPRPANGSTLLPSAPQAPESTSDTALYTNIPYGPSESATDTPVSPGRRSVQFARDDQLFEAPPLRHMRHGSWDARDALGKLRGSNFMSRLKELTVPGAASASQGGRSPAATDSAGPSAANSPIATRQTSRVPRNLDEGSDIDADAEETDAEGIAPDEDAKSKRKRRRTRRPRYEALSAPHTPRGPSADTESPNGQRRLRFLRRSTMPEDMEQRGHMSEGEGRDQLSHAPGWRRGSSWNDPEDADSPSGRRPGHLRRITVLGGGVSDGDAMTPRRPFFGGERASTYGAQKWRQVKKVLGVLTKKRNDQFDFLKSAELMAELRAGAPAVLMLASMIQRDEHGNKRIPVLLEQVRLRVRDSEGEKSNRHTLFTIDLEYGSGPSRMKWTIKRKITEIAQMHVKYKLSLSNEKLLTNRLDLGARPKQPSFPIRTFPYLRGASWLRGVEMDEEDDQASVHGADETAGEGTAGEGTATDAEGRHLPRKKKSRRNLLGLRKTSTLGDPGASNLDLSADPEAAQRRFVERQHRKLEKYLTEMIRWLMFRADSNRLCKFLELSALGIRLAAEGSYHGKECYLTISSINGMDFRRKITPDAIIARHTRKWFLVRQSYIVCVESPENMNIYDVYLVDPKFKIISKSNKLREIGRRGSKTKKAKKQKKITANGEGPGNITNGNDQHELEQMDDLDEDIEDDEGNNGSAKSRHKLKIITSERKVSLLSASGHIMGQFEESILDMLRRTPWHLRNRFNSYAPVRHGVHAQWLVDGRDYMWNVSRAIAMAKDVIYIHDWWLSPELYMRRPACISQKWRLDRLLQRKAREGVKIFIIIYRNVEAAIPIDSEYTKFSLLNLHPNIFVQRSPNQFKKNQFFFAHHEKICVVDHDVAFVGGIDLCFGRWDCPQHPVADDKPTGFEGEDGPRDAEHTQLFPGKDYSNPRVQDFFRLNEPYEEMYDRGKVPRMPWHDISMQVVGQPARDLTRHFVQRWNYVRRGRKPTRPTPFLLPPPDYKKEDLQALGLTGTCEVQILRSASAWSLGIEDAESSIQSAYIKMIEDSEHFVYIENQFFITSTETMNTKMVNRIGDALVDRIIRAHEKDEDWRAVIIIPLMPGFQNEVNEQDGTSVRLILQCQFRSICRGEHSIFGRLRELGIDPEDYIQFFSLRQWGKIGTSGTLTTEQLYIHAKAIVVDDRIALIGSANINERSMLGNRDSEVAAIVRDTDMLWSTMGGKPYRVGRFAHTLRMRLMREHLGLDVDEIMEEERLADMDRQEQFAQDMDRIYNSSGEDDDDDEDDDDEGERGPHNDVGESSNRRRSHKRNGSATAKTRPQPPAMEQPGSFNGDVDLVQPNDDDVDSSSSGSPSPGKNKQPKLTPIQKLATTAKHEREVEGFGLDHWQSAQLSGKDQGRDSVIVNGREVLVHAIDAEGKGTLDKPKLSHHNDASAVSSGGLLSTGATTSADDVSGSVNALIPPMPAFDRRTTEQLGLPRANQLPELPNVDDTDIGGPPQQFSQTTTVDPVTGLSFVVPSAPNPLTADLKLAHIDRDCMRDPLNSNFYDDVWARVAENNTKVFRRVFHCMPDSEVTNWAEYKEFKASSARFMEQQSQQAQNAHPESRGSDSHPPGPAASGDLPPKASTAGAGIGAPGPMAAAKTVVEKVVKGVSVDRPNSGEPGYNEKKSVDGKSMLSVPGSPEMRGRSSIPTGTADPEKAAMGAANDAQGGGSEAFPTLDEPEKKDRRTTFSAAEKPHRLSAGSDANANTSVTTSSALPPTTKPLGSQRQRRRRATTASRSRRGGVNVGADDVLTRGEAEEVLAMAQGTLVQFPYDWLCVEENNGNWLFQVDQVAPLQIYN